MKIFEKEFLLYNRIPSKEEEELIKQAREMIKGIEQLKTS